MIGQGLSLVARLVSVGLLALFLAVTVAPQSLTVGPGAAWAQPHPDDCLGAGGSSQQSGPQFLIDIVQTVLKVILGYERYAEIAASIKQYWDIFKVVTWIYDFFNSIWEQVFGTENAASTARIGGVRSFMKGEAKRTEAYINEMYRASYAKTQAEAAAKHTQPTHHMLCHLANMNRAPATTQENTNQIAEWVGRSLRELGRGPVEDWDGPAYAAFMEGWRRESGFANEDEGYKTKSKEIKLGPYEMPGTDADLLAPRFLDGSVALERPPVEVKVIPWGSGTRAIWVPKVDPNNGAQTAFLAAFMYCVHVQGPHPTPPWGRAIETPAGAVGFAAYQSPAARQDVMNSACGELLGYFSRPAQTAVELVEKGNQLCQSGYNMLSPDVMEKHFANCKRGISQYQAEYLQNVACKTDSYFIAQAAAGAGQQEMTDDATICVAKWDAWLAKVEAKIGFLADAILGRQEIKNDWVGTQAATASAQEDSVATVAARAQANVVTPPIKKANTANPVRLWPAHDPSRPAVMAQ